MAEIKKLFYLSDEIREIWKDHTTEQLKAFLTYGMQLFINHAEMKESAELYLEEHPRLMEVFE